MKRWDIIKKFQISNFKFQIKDIIKMLLENRGVKTKKEKELFLNPPDPYTLSAEDVEINNEQLKKATTRIKKAIKNKESIVVYADYDADGITAGAIMWETIHGLGGNIMPYIPHRVEEGYGLSVKGIDQVIADYHPGLIVTVDHGITAKEKVSYAKKQGIDVIVTDHHTKPKALPECTIVHTTTLCGAGVAWFVAKELLRVLKGSHLVSVQGETLTELTAIGTIADMVPLVGANRAIVKYGLEAINKTSRVGLEALIADAGLTVGALGTYEVSHMLAPRLNAMGRLEHALDALRMLCTKQKEKAMLLAQKLGLTNKERQQLTLDTLTHALDALKGVTLHRQGDTLKKLIFISHESYNQGVIGLVAGKLVEEFYRPAIVVSKGEFISKASARSVSGFNIVEAIRSCSDILVDVGGHPMAAGFTVETARLEILQERMEEIAAKQLTEEQLIRTLHIDMEIPLEAVTEDLWNALRDFEPFGFGNAEPVFMTRTVLVKDARLVGKDGKHLKLRITNHESRITIDAIAFGMGELYGKLKSDQPVDIAYTIDMNVWNGSKKLQLKVKDVQLLPQ